MSLVFLTPLGALVGLAVSIPLAAAFLRERRAVRVRTALGLPAPARWSSLAAAVATLAVGALLAGAAAQPALRTGRLQRVRRDAAAYFVVDVSRSMLAARGDDGQTRFRRAVLLAERLRDAVPDVPAGLATITNRVLPNLLPVTDRASFRHVAEGAPAIDSPPPLRFASRSTNLGSLDELADGGYFPPAAVHRLAVVLTDGETGSFPVAVTAAVLRRSRIRVLVVRTWHSDERISIRGRLDPNYRPDAAVGRVVDRFARATGGAMVGEGEAGTAADLERRLIGSGPSVGRQEREREVPLAVYLVAAAALPLGLLLLARRRSRAPRLELELLPDLAGARLPRRVR